MLKQCPQTGSTRIQTSFKRQGRLNKKALRSAKLLGKAEEVGDYHKFFRKLSDQSEK